MNHFTESLPEGTEVQLSVTYIDYPERREDIMVTATVTGSRDVNGTIFYDLQSNFTQGLGNNSATVQVNDVHPSLIITKE